MVYNEPLNLDVINVDAFGEKIVGQAVIPLHLLLEKNNENNQIASANSEVYVHNTLNMPYQEDANGNHIVDKVSAKFVINYSLRLENMGLFAPYEGIAASYFHEQHHPNEKQINGSVAHYNEAPANIRETQEYQAALELEMWKAEEEESFTKQLADREQQILAELMQEWRAHEGQRESLFKKKVNEYQRLENELRRVLQDVGRRERELATEEMQFRCLRDQQKQQYEAKQRQTQSDAQRKVREAESALNREKKNTEHWQRQAQENSAQINQLQRELGQLRLSRKLKQPPNRPDQAKEESGSGDFSKAQAECIRLQLELAQSKTSLAQTEAKLSEAQQTSIKHRQMWSRALQEVSRLRQEVERLSRQHLDQRGAELDRLRDHLMGFKSTGSIVPGTNQNAPTEVSRMTDLRSVAERVEGECSANIVANNGVGKDGFGVCEDPCDEASKTSRLQYLQGEKQSLLDTGVYDSSDPLIQELEEEIRRVNALPV